MSHIRWLVDTASMRHGSKVGRVRLDQQTVPRDRSGDAAQLLRALEGGDPREGDVEPERNADPGELRPGREAVQDGIEAPSPALVLKDLDHLRVGLAGMDDKRQ